MMTMDSPIGTLLLEGEEAGVRCIRLLAAGEKAPALQGNGMLERAAGQIAAYFAGESRTMDFPIVMRGTAFELAVWQALRRIPYGKTCTYGELAALIGHDGAARAVGGACRRNPLLIAVPCHRVIAAGGALTGFAAGLEAKRTLLRLEGHALSADTVLCK